MPKHIRRAKGFTIVELLIVIVVIAILAAIVTVAYNGISLRAKESAASAAASQAAKKVLTYAVDNAEQFPSSLSTVKILDDTNTVYEYSYNNSAKSYCITATFQGVSYYVSNSNSNPVKGLCPGHVGSVPQGPWTDIATGSSHTCGIYQGKAYCWGRSQYGELGAPGSSSTVPVAVTGVLASKTVTDIDTGTNSTCAVAEGLAYCWGRNDSGQIGDGTTTASAVPVAVSTSGVLAGKTVTQISVGTLYACALADGQAYCWGSDSYATLGNGASGSSTTPVAVDTTGVLSGKTVTAVQAGWRNNCVMASGAAYCWGTGSWGAVGNGTTATAQSPSALNVSGVLAGKTVTMTDGGEFNACAVASDAAYCWGYNASGRLGNNSTTESSSPVAVDTSGVLSGKVVTHITAGGNHTCAVASGAAYCWGAGNYGALGDGTTNTSYVPVAVVMTGVLAGKTVTKISADNYFHTCALASGQAYCWGYDEYGKLGNGAAGSSTEPALVVNP